MENCLELDRAMPPEAIRYVADSTRYADAIDWSGYRVWRDMSYGPSSYQQLDVFAPRDQPNCSLPIFMYIHGGGWTHGNKSWMTFMAPTITALPAVFVSPSYGLAPEHLYPTPIEDCLAALAYMRAYAADFGADPDRICLGGHSVGGHIASMIALRPELREKYGIPAESICACIPVSGLFRVLDHDPTAAHDLDDASPMHWATQATMPFYVSYGENDYGRIIEENSDFIAALGQTSNSLQSHLLVGLDHYTANLSHADPGSTWYRAVTEIFRKIS